MVNPSLQERIGDLAALEEPTRRSLYFLVAEAAEPLSRNQAAHALEISRSLAGFHLDRLVADGLLEVFHRRLSGRSGPGAGRPAKLYRRADRQVEISLPQRDYGLAAGILASAVAANPSLAMSSALDRAARGAGRRIGQQAAAVPAAVGAGMFDTAVTALAAQGYEPVCGRQEVRLRNCPFHGLLDQHGELVCRLNLALIQGLVEGLGTTEVRALLEPRERECCVSLKRIPP